MDRLLQWARFMARAGAWFGGGLVLLAAFVISIDVLMRKLFDTTSWRRKRDFRLCAGNQHHMVDWRWP